MNEKNKYYCVQQATYSIYKNGIKEEKGIVTRKLFILLRCGVAYIVSIIALSV